MINGYINTFEGKQNKMITPENKKKAAKLGAKGGKFAALFGFGKLKENVDMGEFEGFADSKSSVTVNSKYVSFEFLEMHLI